jgi:hypothetical protein
MSRITRTVHESPYKFMIISRSFLPRMKNVSDKSCRENRRKILCSIIFFLRKFCRLWHNVKKYCRAVQATDDNMTHAHCMLDNEVYKYTLRMYNTYCFSIAIIVARSLLSVTLPVLLGSYISPKIGLCFRENTD